VSVKFDPYHALSLPLPTPSKVGVVVFVERTTTDLVHHFHRWLVPTREDAVADAAYGATTAHTPLARAERFEAQGLSLDKADRASSIAAGVAGAAGISNKRLFVFKCDASFNAVGLDSSQLMSVYKDGAKDIFAAELVPHALAVPSPEGVGGGEDAARRAWARLKPSWWPDRPEELSGQDLQRFCLVVDHLCVDTDAAALSSQSPTVLPVPAALKGTMSAGPPGLVSLPRSASLAHVRYAVAASAFCFIKRDALVRVLAQLGELPADADPAAPPPDHVLLYHMARTLPIAMVQGFAPPHSRDHAWLPTFDHAAPAADAGGGDAPAIPAPPSAERDGRAVRLDAWLHFSGPIPASPDDPTRPTDKFSSCRVVWRGVWGAALDDDRVVSHRPADSLRPVLMEVEER
jgi:hypothetical protein